MPGGLGSQRPLAGEERPVELHPAFVDHSALLVGEDTQAVARVLGHVHPQTQPPQLAGPGERLPEAA